MRRLDDFARFVEVVTFSHGSVVNTAQIAREAHIQRETTESYIQILEDLYLGFRLPVFTRRAKRQLTVHAKFYWFDAGIFRSIRPAGPLDRPEEIGGAALEGLVVQHLRAWIEYSSKDSALFFWRTKSGTEVDFVVYGEGEFSAFEVQNSRNIRPRDLRGLRSFREDYPSANATLLYRGSERLENRRHTLRTVRRLSPRRRSRSTSTLKHGGTPLRSGLTRARRKQAKVNSPRPIST